jgi:hypothetical protein
VALGSGEASNGPARHHCEAVLAVTPTALAYALSFLWIEYYKNDENIACISIITRTPLTPQSLPRRYQSGRRTRTPRRRQARTSDGVCQKPQAAWASGATKATRRLGGRAHAVTGHQSFALRPQNDGRNQAYFWFALLNRPCSIRDTVTATRAQGIARDDVVHPNFPSAPPVHR